ncbi:MATE family efflux transporter [Clostridium sp. NSJ-145]|uniref:MATE family efflux transporter n=1 Tax=Clostridium sp. NSJ-145 TaxID=2897777 RepID=UPI001E5F57A5|nr:MATE family efflux transporter [Clostridium sp. NSJ-145]MCD2503123.1 MATE family efflux transporter [Clostridium sp. NSJ-145]
MENKMGTEEIRKLLIKMSLPLMISLLISNLYNLIDSMYVSSLGESALSAVSLSAPIMMMMAAFGSGNAIGLNAVLSKALGEKNDDKVKKAIRTALFLALASYIVIVTSRLIIVEPYFNSQTNDAEIIRQGTEYLNTVMFLAFGVMFQWVLERLLISTGKTKLFMITLSSGAIINIILDPVFIFGLSALGIPALGVKGAAVATVFGQTFSAFLALYFNYKFNKELDMKFSIIPDWHTFIEMLKTGIPTAFMQGFVSVVTMGVNMILISFSTTAVAIYGVVLKVLNMILIMPHGMGLGVIPVVAYNYGAKKRSRVKEAIKFSVIFSIVVGTIGMIILNIIPALILNMFNPTEEMQSIGITAIRILSVTIPLGGISIVLSSFFQGLGLAKYSMYLSLARQIILLMPIVFLLSLTEVLPLVWLGFPIAEGLAIIIGYMLYKRSNIEVISKIEEELEEKCI